MSRTDATGSLQLNNVNLKTDHRGRLLVDHQFRTQIPHIFAAGDVIGFPPNLAATSSKQGRLAVCHASGIQAEPIITHFPMDIYSLSEISMVGLTEEQLNRKRSPTR